MRYISLAEVPEVKILDVPHVGETAIIAKKEDPKYPLFLLGTVS